MSTVLPAAKSVAAPRSKQSRVLQRTKVGGVLAVAVALALYCTAGPNGVRVALGAGLVLSLWGLVEADRIGLTRRRGATFAAAAAAVVGALLTFAWLDPLSPRQLPAEWSEGARYWRGLGLVVAGGLSAALLGSLPGLAQGAAEHGRRRALPTVLIAAWFALPLLAVAPLRHVLGVGGLVAFLLLSKIGDIAGYYVGNAIGETHPFPRISPGKTTAGCVASLVAGVAAGVAVQLGGLLPLPTLGLASGALAGLFVNLAAQAGDLLESAAKRRVGVKDAATTFGPSGGMLDLVDSLLVAGPVALVTWPFLFHWAL